MSWPRVVFILNLSHVTDGIRHRGPKELHYRRISNVISYMGSGSPLKTARPLKAVPRVRDKRHRTGKGVYSALFRSLAGSQPVPSDCPSRHSALTFEKESGKVTVDRQRNSIRSTMPCPPQTSISLRLGRLSHAFSSSVLPTRQRHH